MQLFTHQFHLIVTVMTLFFAIISFIREKIPAHITALLVMATLLLFGVISTGEALSVFSNNAPITIASMFVIGAALKNTGVLDQMVSYLIRIAEKNFWLAIAAFYLFVLIASAFMNNTPIVIIMTPVIIMITRKFNHYPSKFLIPLSYIAIMGGTCTLIGTSTNLLVNGIVITSQVPSFNIFDISLPGLIMAAAGILFLLIFGDKLLPVRPLFTEEVFTPEAGNKHFIANAMVLPESESIGKTLDELGFPQGKDCLVIDIIRKDKSLTESLSHQQNQVDYLLRNIPLQSFDRILIRSNKEKLIAVNKLKGLILGAREGLSELREAKETVVMEGIVGPGSRLIHSHISSAWIRRRYNCHIWALHRQNKIIKKNFSKIPLKFGDVLLIEGTSEDLDDFFKNEEVVSLTTYRKRAFSKKGLIALLTIIAVVVLSALNFMPISGLALIGAILVIFTECITPQKAYESIDWRILMLIFGMLTLSIAMEKTGIAEFIVQNTASFTSQFGPRAILISIYFMTSLLTELMTNNAAAVLITPLIISLTLKLGLNPQPFIVAIMFAASASYATPLGYQTNTYVYNAGNYQFRDFLKIGIPMNIINLITAVLVIPLFWDLKQ
ncbi:SLC13 family permease [Legionella israelensis]|uniref:SLC13 family permease n=1 Tax=Legionella israelensis TaxID=454 RepID=UPI00117E219A|nr:SLC13 family permease [Legionella israelensis]QDP73333.1 SLC13 family permease [Legionella israelensis]